MVHLDRKMAELLAEHREAVQHFAEVPGLGGGSAQQMIAEVGPTAATFPSAKGGTWPRGQPCADAATGREDDPGPADPRVSG